MLTICSGCWIVPKWCLSLFWPHGVYRQAPLSTGFPRQEYWSGLPFPFAKDISNPGNLPFKDMLRARFWTRFFTLNSFKRKYLNYSYFVQSFNSVIILKFNILILKIFLNGGRKTEMDFPGFESKCVQL